ncbi:MAG: VC0807 family protein [Acidimicrobiales bacterium]
MLELPSLRASIRHSLPMMLEAIVAPFGLFYLMLMFTGIKGACIAGLGWSYLALLRRILAKERIPGTLIFGTITLSVRTAVTLLTGSAFFYFAQPTAGTALLALVFLATAVLRRPFIERLAHDYCPLDPDVMARPAVRRFFIQLSLLWALVLMMNAGFVMWMLLTTSLRVFVVERTAVTWFLMGAAILISIFWFVRAMRREKLTVRFSKAVQHT